MALRMREVPADRLRAYRSHDERPGTPVPTENIEKLERLIVKAIRERALLRIEYEPGLREIEPHALGRSRAGDLLLRAYQVRGATAGGEESAWKLFRCARIGPILHYGPPFTGPREGYRKGDRAMAAGIIAEL